MTAANVTSGIRRCPSCSQPTSELRCPVDGTETVVVGGFTRDALSYKAGEIVAGRYRVSGILGKGGFGAVYAAEHTGTRQPIALKVLTVDPATAEDDVIARFYREAQITAQLNSRHTVRVFDVGQADGGPMFQAMELLRGPTLEQVLRRLKKAGQTLSETQAIDVALPILGSLQEAHKAGLVHRDLKPANIMLADLGEDEPVVKVLDFGIARTEDSSLTGKGKALGTPAYMSPEQCQGRALDGRADLYSLGVILYRCVTGALPFESANALTLMWMHANNPIPDPRRAGALELSDGLVECFEIALAKHPDDRFSDARDMRWAFEAVRGGAWGGTPAQPLRAIPDLHVPARSRPSSPSLRRASGARRPLDRERPQRETVKVTDPAELSSLASPVASPQGAAMPEPADIDDFPPTVQTPVSGTMWGAAPAEESAASSGSLSVLMDSVESTPSADQRPEAHPLSDSFRMAQTTGLQLEEPVKPGKRSKWVAVAGLLILLAAAAAWLALSGPANSTVSGAGSSPASAVDDSAEDVSAAAGVAGAETTKETIEPLKVSPKPPKPLPTPATVAPDSATAKAAADAGRESQTSQTDRIRAKAKAGLAQTASNLEDKIGHLQEAVTLDPDKVEYRIMLNEYQSALAKQKAAKRPRAARRRTSPAVTKPRLARPPAETSAPKPVRIRAID